MTKDTTAFEDSASLIENKLDFLKRNKETLFMAIARFLPKILINIENKKYIIRTARNGEDLLKVLMLRHKIYYRELLGREHPLGVDYDDFDPICDHLMVVEKKTGRCVGTYRFNNTLFSDTFYTQTEFQMDELFTLEGNKLEIGRACIDSENRCAIICALLWQGLGHYIDKTDSKWVFGCSSVFETEPEQVARAYSYFLENHYEDIGIRVRPLEKYTYENLAGHLAEYRASGGEGDPCAVPPLVRFYFKAGAIMLGEPALDREFKCIDFFTLLDTDLVGSKINKRYRTA